MGKKNPAELAAVQIALAELLGGLGFKAMSEQAAKEEDRENLELYARIIMKNAPPAMAEPIRQRLAFLRLL